MKTLLTACLAFAGSIAFAQPSQDDILLTCKTLARLASTHVDTNEFDKIVLLHNAYRVAKSSLQDPSAVQEFDTFWEQMKRYKYPVLAVEYDEYKTIPPDWRHHLANPLAVLSPSPGSGATPTIPGWKYHEIRWLNEMAKAGLKLQDLEISVDTAKDILVDKPLPSGEPEAKQHIKIEKLGTLLDPQ